MSAATTIKKGDRLPVLSATLKSGGSAIDLTGAGVVFRMTSGATTVTGTCTIVDATAGRVEYPWASGDTDVAGQYRGEFVITHSDGKLQTLPSHGYLKIFVTDTLA